MENLRLGVSAVRHDMKREETVEEAEKNTELGRQTPKPAGHRLESGRGFQRSRDTLLCVRSRLFFREFFCALLPGGPFGNGIPPEFFSPVQ